MVCARLEEEGVVFIVFHTLSIDNLYAFSLYVYTYTYDLCQCWL